MPNPTVSLSNLPDLDPFLIKQKAAGVEIRRGLPGEKQRIIDWIKEHCNPSWASACEMAFDQEPITCYIAVIREEQANQASEKQIGFACFDIASDGVYGPTCIIEEYENTDLETAILLVCLHAMADKQYQLASIGWGGYIRLST